MVAKLVLDTTTEGIWLIDTEARTTFVNQRIADLLGYSRQEMIGRPVFDFLDRERWPIARQNLEERARGVEARQEVQLVRKDGTRVWVLGSTNPVFDANGRYAGALALVGDLSIQKQREFKLRAQIDALSGTTEAPPFREPFRTAIVLGVMATYAATTAFAAIGAVASVILGVPTGPGEL